MCCDADDTTSCFALLWQSLATEPAGGGVFIRRFSQGGGNPEFIVVSDICLSLIAEPGTSSEAKNMFFREPRVTLSSLSPFPVATRATLPAFPTVL